VLKRCANGGSHTSRRLTSAADLPNGRRDPAGPGRGRFCRLAESRRRVRVPPLCKWPDGSGFHDPLEAIDVAGIVPDSGIRFEDRGAHTVKGIPEQLRLLAVANDEA